MHSCHPDACGVSKRERTVGDWSLRTSPPRPLELGPSPPLFAGVFIAPKGAESQGGDRAIGALGYFFPSEAV